jgi:hypothetical protein
VQRTNLLPGVATTVAAIILSGCYPSFLTSRPDLEIIVTDESGVPIEGATVTLGTMEWRGVVGKTTLEEFVTDREGKVEFDSQRRWVMQLMLPDGDTRYSWSLCFSKPGFEAIPKTLWKFNEVIKVAMYPSAAASECEWQRLFSRPRVKEREARWIEVAGGEWETHIGFAMTMDETIRAAMEASARQQGIKLRSWSEYRFQYQARGHHGRDRRLFVRAICRAPADFDLTLSFYSEPDDRACFFDTTYTIQIFADQPKSAFGPLKLAAGRADVRSSRDYKLTSDPPGVSIAPQ